MPDILVLTDSNTLTAVSTFARPDLEFDEDMEE
jgi:hypothetical protein